MKYLLCAFTLFTSSGFCATNTEVLAFLAPIEGQYTMTGKGCGNVSIEASDQGRYIDVKTKGELFSLSFADFYKISKNTLTYSYAETDNAWPNLSDWTKEEIVIQKDHAGRLTSVSYKRRKGKPFYVKKVSTYFCKI